MLKNLILLPDGTELSSGSGLENVITSVKTTQCVNVDDDLNPGSAFASILEASLRTPNGGLYLTAGDDVTLFKLDDTGSRTQIGVFTLDKPTRPTANTMKITGYDHVAKLDIDLTDWLKTLTGWPYTLTTFAKMVCNQCGLTYIDTDVPNGDFQVYEFGKSGVTGRQIMRWLGQICCRFVRATASGDIEFGWYTRAHKSITPSGDPYIFANGLSYETYSTTPVSAVQIRLADSADGELWPPAEDGSNPYIISGNAILLSRVTEDMLPYLDVIKTELEEVTYTPCAVSIPSNLDIRAGNIVDITDKYGHTITAYVMKKTTSGHKDTLECTGNYSRDSSAAVNNKSEYDKSAESENYANSAAKHAVENQTQTDIFNKLTNNGGSKGLFMKDGQLYINASYLATGVITSEDGSVQIDLANNKVIVKTNADGKDGRIEISSNSIVGYGWDSVENTYTQSLVIYPGGRYSENTGYSTHISCGSDSNTLYIDGGNSLNICGFGVEISGSAVYINTDDGTGLRVEGKHVSWKSNGDGTYTLIGS